MMKISSTLKASVFLLICHFAMTGNAQTTEQISKKFRINVLTGLALPYGELGSKHFNYGGYAIYGNSSAIEGIWQFCPNLAAGLSFSFSRFPFDENTYAQDLVNSDPFMDMVYMKSDPYEVLTYTTAIYYNKSIWKKFSLTGKLGGGIMWAQTPDQLFNATYFGVPNRGYKITPSRDTKFAFSAGIACDYQLFNQVDLSFYSNYYLADMAFGFKTPTTTYVRKLTFSYINAGVGIGFVF